MIYLRRTWPGIVVAGSLIVLAICFGLLLQSIRVGGAPTIYHDDARAVTCWLYTTSISCLPDSEVKP